MQHRFVGSTDRAQLGGVHRWLIVAATFSILAGQAISARSDDEHVNYDEAKVPAYVLPDPLVNADGSDVADEGAWRKAARRDSGAVSRRSMAAGRVRRRGGEFRVVESAPALDGAATRKRVRMEIVGPTGQMRVDPAHAVRAALGSAIAGAGVRGNAPVRVERERSRAVHAARRELRRETARQAIDAHDHGRGYAVATLDAKDFCPDDKDHFREGVPAALSPDKSGNPGPGARRDRHLGLGAQPGARLLSDRSRNRRGAAWRRSATRAWERRHCGPRPKTSGSRWPFRITRAAAALRSRARLRRDGRADH